MYEETTYPNKKVVQDYRGWMLREGDKILVPDNITGQMEPAIVWKILDDGMIQVMFKDSVAPVLRLGKYVVKNFTEDLQNHNT